MKHTNRRHTLILDKAFQFRQILAIVAVSILASNAVILVGYFVLGEVLIAPMRTAGWVIGLVELVIILSVVIYGVRASHHIAGPVFAIKRVLKSVQDGDLTQQVHLRDGDNLQDLGDSVNLTTFSLNERVEKIQHNFVELKASLRTGEDYTPALNRLEESIESFHHEHQSATNSGGER